jgi:hypothetical protein
MLKKVIKKLQFSEFMVKYKGNIAAGTESERS